MDLNDIFKDRHSFLAGQTGSGKSTLLKSVFLAPTRDKIFRCQILPDVESKELYAELGIPLFHRSGQVAHAYFNDHVSHCSLDPEAKFMTGKDPVKEILDTLNLVFEEKYLIAKSGKYTTPPAYFLIDEAQNLMTRHKIPSEIKLVASEGRKIDMWLITISQRITWLHQDLKTQSANIGLGFMSMEDSYLEEYNLRAPKELYTFNIYRNGEILVLKSRPIALKLLKKLFRSG